MPYSLETSERLMKQSNLENELKQRGYDTLVVKK